MNFTFLSMTCLQGATRMLLGNVFHAFVHGSPISVMFQGTLERVFDPAKIDQLFEEHAVRQYTRQLAFSQCVQLMSDVVFKTSPSVNAWVEDHLDELGVTRTAVYDKLQHVELPTAEALVKYSAQTMRSAMKQLKFEKSALLPGYCLRILDGTHLAGTEHRPKVTRGYRAAALPGQVLAFYNPQSDLIEEVICCEDAHAQERSLTEQILSCVKPGDCIIDDRNFCTTRLLFGIHNCKAHFVTRQHGSTLNNTLIDKRKPAGKDAEGRQLYRQEMSCTNPASEESLILRRITIELQKPTSNGHQELHLLTNLPEEISDIVIADLYRDRWTIEAAFQRLKKDLRTEIDTLAYPKAALFGCCVAMMAYNVVSMVKSTIKAAHGTEWVTEKLSTYYLTLEISRVARGMEIAIPAKAWKIFGKMTDVEYVSTMIELAKKMNLRKYTKHKRGVKKPPPKKLSGKNIKHVSTAKLLANNTK